ncbi:MAG: hypothetical protein V9G19_12300 [Tetrasphaera sp.]
MSGSQTLGDPLLGFANDSAPSLLPAGVSRRATLAGLGGLALPAMAGAMRPLEVGKQYRSTGRTLTDLTRTLGVCISGSGNQDSNLAALRGIGATWVRTKVHLGYRSQPTWFAKLAANGIKVNGLMGNPDGDGGTPEQLVARVAESLAPYMNSLEGANEWNLNGGSDWLPELVNHQTRLWNAAKGNAVTRGIPVLGPALGMRQGYEEFGNRSSIMDYGNFHLYTGGYVPGYRTDDMIARQRIVCGSKPMYVTETGWHNAVNWRGPHYYTPEAVAGLYAPRLLLEYFIRDVPKLAIYKLTDSNDPDKNDRESNFGLLRVDGSRKPAYTSFANLNTIMTRQYRTGGRAGTPLSFTFRGGPADLRTALVARPDGRYLFFLWRSQAAVWDPKKRLNLTPTTETATIDWGGTRSVRRFAPATSSTAISTTTTSQSSVELKAQLEVLEVSPA